MTLKTSPNYGLANKDNFLLGRGVLKLDLFAGGATETAKFIDMGNATAFSLNIDEETLEHTSKRTGLAQIDQSVTLSKELTGSFTLDEYDVQQLATALSADVDELTFASASVYNAASKLVGVVIPADSGGHSIELFDASKAGTPLNPKRLRGLTDQGMKVSLTTVPATTYNDWTIDLATGHLHITAGGDLDSGAPRTLDIWDITYPAGKLQQIHMLKQTAIRATLHFASKNAQSGLVREVKLHRVKISTNGELPWIAEEYSAMEFSFAAEASTLAVYAESPVGTITQFYPD